MTVTPAEPDDANSGGSRPSSRVSAFFGFQRSVSDLARSTAFYCEALGFRAEVDALPFGESRSVRLRLGAQTIELLERPDGAYPDDRYARGAIDTGFQHLAIVAADLSAAWTRLQARGAPRAISTAGPVQLPTASGGVTAFKFLDPDGHPLELIEFPAGQGAAIWQRSGSGEATLGIDHSAIVVANAMRSVAFYRDVLGFEVAATQVNRGPAQDRLDGMTGVVVDVIALRPADAPTPHLELLCYQAPEAGKPEVGQADLSDRLLWRASDAAGAFALPEGRPPGRGTHDAACEWQDPDGHRHLLVSPRARAQGLAGPG